MHDAFNAGVEPGGLYSSQEIKILICYMLRGAGEPMPRQAVLDLIAGDGMANFFETGAAVDELLRHGSLQETADGCLRLTDEGALAADTLAGMIPYTLRERSVKAAMRLLARIRRERENQVDIRQLEHGCAVTCTLNDAREPLMSVTLRVADHLQAQLVKEQFLEDPSLLYRSVLAILTGDAGLQRNGSQIVIDWK